MYFEIHHETRYTYNAPVELGRHTLRLRPISDANQHVHRFEMMVTPKPAGMSDLSDLDGNYATAIWFEGQTTELSIETDSVVQTLRTNPLDYLWEGPTSLPLRYSPAYAEAMRTFQASLVPREVRELAETIAVAAGMGAQHFPVRLASELHARFARIRTPDAVPLDALETLRRGEGSSRDLAVLYMATARSQGFAARFVSGYNTARGDDEQDLHAWAELYMPGGGWRGFDPTTGQAVAARHVAVAAGALAEQAEPVSGTHTPADAGRQATHVSIREVTSAA